VAWAAWRLLDLRTARAPPPAYEARHEHELYLAIANIDHTRTKVKSPHTNGICERFHKTLLDEFYRVAFRKEVYETPQ